MQEKQRILVVDDEPEIREVLRMMLSSEGYEILEAGNAEKAVEQCEGVDLVILDIMMPGESGIWACTKIREKTNVPILFLTAKSETEDIVQGLNAGADDYITKPFAPAEVLARVRSHLRRYAKLGSRAAQDSGALTIGGITLNYRTKTLTVEGEHVFLTPTEYSILHTLMCNPGKIYSTKALYEAVWQETAIGSEGAVAVHIRHLREKIEINPSEPRYLKVVWGQGYKMEGERE